MVVEILKAVLFGIVEGITEWLPISSTGHLILLEEFVGFNLGMSDAALMDEFMAMFQVVIQLGAIMAVVVTYWKKLVPRGFKSDMKTWRLWFKIAVASIPAAVVGVVADKLIENITGRDIDGWIYNVYVVVAALIVYGVLFILIERGRKSNSFAVNDVDDISYSTAFLIGVFQMLAIIPGTSRSGSTILGSMLLGISRAAAAEFSFFMAIPAMVGAGGIKLLGFLEYAQESSSAVPAEAVIVLVIACIVAFAVSMIAIKFLTDFVKKHTFSAFGVYRILLGIAVLIYFAVK